MQVTQEQFLKSIARIIIYGHDYAHDLLEEEKKEQKTSYPFIRLWCELHGINEYTIKIRTDIAKTKKLPSDTVFKDGISKTLLSDLSKGYLIQMLKLSVSK